MLKVAVTTLGCKVNQCESAGISEALLARGMALVPFEEEADCYIINTCTVTGRTDGESRRLIRRTIRRNPAAAVLVTGCYAQRSPEEIAGIPGVRMVAGNAEKTRIPEFIEEMSANGPRIRVGEIGKEKEIVRPAAASFPGHTRAFLKIQDGCDASCSYCIVPHVRGGSRSIPPEEVLGRISSLGGAGFREVVLTGIHLGAYGRDLQPAADLSSLVRRIAEGSSVERLRLSSIEPREVTDELLALIGNSSGRICRHLHIPLQSGDDAILAVMNRDYDGDFFRGLIEKVRCAVPGIAMGIDVMAGFPGETEAAFERTLRLVEELPVAYLHVFPFSRRPGTPAASMTGQVSQEEKMRRTQRLRALGAAKRRSFAERFLGKTLEVLVEERQDRETRHLVGLSDNYIPVAVRGDVSANRIVRVRPEAFRNGRLFAEALAERGLSPARILPSEADE